MSAGNALLSKNQENQPLLPKNNGCAFNVARAFCYISSCCCCLSILDFGFLITTWVSSMNRISEGNETDSNYDEDVEPVLQIMAIVAAGFTTLACLSSLSFLIVKKCLNVQIDVCEESDKLFSPPPNQKPCCCNQLSRRVKWIPRDCAKPLRSTLTN